MSLTGKNASSIPWFVKSMRGWIDVVSRFGFLIFLISICFSHLHIGTLAVDAIRYAWIANNILVSGDWINLVDGLSDSPYANKPPLLFWWIAFLFQIFGYSTFIAKLASVIFGFIAVLGLWWLVRSRLGDTAAILAVVFFCVNPNFSKNIVDLSFEGLVCCSTVLCILAMTKAIEGRSSPVGNGLLLGLGLALFLQSKPPYVGIVSLPILGALYFVWLRHGARSAILTCLGATPLVLLAGGWFLFKGEEYIAAALDNQLALPLESRPGGIAMMFYWVWSFLLSYLAVAIFGTLGVVDHFKTRFQRGSPLEIVGLLFSTTIPVVMTLVDLRPRYLVVGAMGLTIIAASYAAKVLPKHLVQPLNPALAVIGIIISTVLLGSSVRIHRSDPFVEAFGKLDSEEIESAVCCVVADTLKRSRYLAREAGLLIELEYEHKGKVMACEDLLASGLMSEARPKIIIVSGNDHHKWLAERGLPLEYVVDSRSEKKFTVVRMGEVVVGRPY